MGSVAMNVHAFHTQYTEYCCQTEQGHLSGQNFYSQGFWNYQSKGSEIIKTILYLNLGISSAYVSGKTPDETFTTTLPCMITIYNVGLLILSTSSQWNLIYVQSARLDIFEIGNRMKSCRNENIVLSIQGKWLSADWDWDKLYMICFTLYPATLCIFKLHSLGIRDFPHRGHTTQKCTVSRKSASSNHAYWRSLMKRCLVIAKIQTRHHWSSPNQGSILRCGMFNMHLHVTWHILTRSVCQICMEKARSSATSGA